MALLSQEAKAMISTMRPAMVATADAAGKPNVSPKGSFQVLDDEHVLFAEVNSPRTVANLSVNPYMSAIVLDPATRHGCRIWGQADIFTSGALFDRINAELAARKMQAKHVVVVTVDNYVTF
jgi:uncharacterized protein